MTSEDKPEEPNLKCIRCGMIEEYHYLETTTPLCRKFVSSEQQTEPFGPDDFGFHLKNCPFCDSAPIWVNEIVGDGQYYIHCIPCNFTIQDDRRDKVAAHWNNRPVSLKKKI